MLPTEILNPPCPAWSNVVPRNTVESSKAPRLRDATLALSSRRSWGAAVLLAGAAILIAPDVQAQEKNADGSTTKRVLTGKMNAQQSQPPPAKAATIDAGAPLRTLDVRVVNARTGRPEPAVTIRVSLGLKKEGTSDDDGRFRIAGTVPQFSNLQIQIQKAGFVPLRVTWNNAFAEIPFEIPRELTVALEPGSTIGGTVQDEQGRPVAEATVHLSIRSAGSREAGKASVALDRFETKTDAQGRWRCDIAPAHLEVISIRVEHADYVVESGRTLFRLQSPREFAELYARNAVVVLKHGVTLAGRVTNSAGNAIAEARVSLVRSLRRKPFVTDAEGHFEFEQMPAGPTDVAIHADGYALTLQEVVVAPNMAPIEIRLEAGRTISGRVVDEAKKPVAGALIRFELGPSTRTMGPRTTSDQEGRFRIDGIPAGGGSLVVSRGVNIVTRRVIPSDEDEVFVLALPKREMLRLVVTVADAASGQPIPSFNVVLRGAMMERFAATGGRYERTLNRLPSRAGIRPLRVEIEADGYFPSEFRTVPTDRDEVTLDIGLEEGLRDYWFIPTTGRSLSTAPSPNCSTSC